MISVTERSFAIWCNQFLSHANTLAHFNPNFLLSPGRQLRYWFCPCKSKRTGEIFYFMFFKKYVSRRTTQSSRERDIINRINKGWKAKGKRKPTYMRLFMRVEIIATCAHPLSLFNRNVWVDIAAVFLTEVPFFLKQSSVLEYLFPRPSCKYLTLEWPSGDLLIC